MFVDHFFLTIRIKRKKNKILMLILFNLIFCYSDPFFCLKNFINQYNYFYIKRLARNFNYFSIILLILYL